MKRTIITTLMALLLSGVAVSSAEAQRVIIRSRPVYVAPFGSPFYDPFWGPSYYVPKSPEQIQAENEARAIKHQRHEEKKLEKQRQKELREQQPPPQEQMQNDGY
jgi:hypothetical protein